MEKVLAATIIFIVIAYVAHTMVEAYCESIKAKISKWAMCLCKVVVGAILFVLLMCLGKCQCSTGYEDAPTGETTLEHYEPR